MSSLERTPHLQGLQIDDGALCDPQATRLWLAAFMLREAILIAPDNFVPAEEALYFTNIARFIKASLDLAEQEACGEKYKMPYIVRACMDAFNTARAAKTKVVKSTLLDTLSIQDEPLARRRGLVTSPLKLRADESNQFFVVPSRIFWIDVLKKINSDRIARHSPPLEMPKPNASHHRAFVWDTVYSDLQFTTQLPWLSLRASWDMVQGDEECRVDPREPPAIAVDTDVAASDDALISDRPTSPKGKTKDLGDSPPSSDEAMEVDPSPHGAISSVTVQPSGNPKRPRQSGEDEAMDTAETQRSTSPTPPTKKPKTAHVDPKASGDLSSSSLQTTNHTGSVQASTPGNVTAIHREQEQPVEVADPNTARVESQRSIHTVSSTPQSTNTVGTSQSSQADEVTARPRGKAQHAEVIQPVAEETSPSHRATSIAISESDDSQASGDESEISDEETTKGPAHDVIVVDDSDDDNDEWKPQDHQASSENEDQIDADPTDEEEDEKAQQHRKAVRRPAPMPIESFDEARYNLPHDKIVFDPFSALLPLVWFFLHPFAKQIFEEQWAPYACITCLRLGIPCVVNLGAFVGCYSCKKRGQACTLKPRVGKGKMTNLKLCWWLGLMHHIQSIVELGTTQGAIGTIPNYGATNILVADNIPDWVPAAAITFRKKMSAAEVSKRWTHLQNNVIPKWHFYAMPHSVLAKLGTNRPVRPFWPNTGDNKETIEKAIKILAAGRNGTLPRLFAINVQDGFDYHEMVKKAPKPSKPKDKKQPKDKDGAVEQQDVDEHNGQRRITRASKAKKKARSPVPSQTDVDEAPVTDLEPAPSFTDDIQDESVMPCSPLRTDAGTDEAMEVSPASISEVCRPTPSRVATVAGPSRDDAQQVTQDNEASISRADLRPTMAEVQTNAKATLTHRRANDDILPNILQTLQTVEVRSMFGKNGMRKGLNNLDHRMNVFCTDMSALQQQVVAQGRKLADAAQTIDNQHEVLKTQQQLLTAILDILKDTPTSAVVSTLKAEVASLHNHIDTSSGAMLTHFNGVADRIAFTDQERDVTAGGVSGFDSQLNSGVVGGEGNVASDDAFIEQYTKSTMEIDPVTDAPLREPHPQSAVPSAASELITSPSMSRDLPAADLADRVNPLLTTTSEAMVMDGDGFQAVIPEMPAKQ